MLDTREKIVRVFRDVLDKDVYYFKHEENGGFVRDRVLFDRGKTYWVWSCKKHRYIKYSLLADLLEDIDKEVNFAIHQEVTDRGSQGY